MKLLGSNPAPEVVGTEELPAKSNYFIGNDPQEWRTNVSAYAKVRYQSVYPGVDLVYYGNQRQLEYDFVVAPGADPSSISLDFTGADRREVDAQGDLVLHLDGEQVRFHKPVIFQQVDHARREVAGNYALDGQGRVSFDVASYDRSQPLIIDPVLSYSTYLGGINTEYAFGVAVDSVGNAYVTGYTESSNFPTTVSGFDTSLGGPRDVFVAKLNPAASGAASLIYSTYVGGSDYENPNGIAVDSAGNAYITGYTQSPDFPTTPNGYSTTLTPSGGTFSADAFVTKLNPTGSGLLYSTYLGGTNVGEQGIGIAVDSIGNAYVTGDTDSSNFPTVNAYDATYGGFFDVFVAKLNTTASGSASLVYSTYLGGNGGDQGGNGIAVDSAGIAYVTGYTNSSIFPTTANAYRTTLSGSRDAFIVKLNPAMSGTASLLYSTYLGGATGDDDGYGIAVDSSGIAYITGYTQSSDFPTVNAYDTTYNGGFDVFVAKLNPAISGTASLLYSTYLGGSGSDFGYGIAVDSAGNAYVGGYTTSFNFPLLNSLVSSFSGSDAFIVKLNPALSGGASLVYSTFLGGSGGSLIQGTIGLDAAGNVYIGGSTPSSDFPTVNAYDSTWNGSALVPYDAFVAKLGASVVVVDTTGPVTSNVAATPNPVAVGNSSTLTAKVDDSTTGGSNIASAAYNIDGGSFNPMTAADAVFDQVSENVTATVPPFMAAGSHTLCVRGTDAAGNTGTSVCILLSVGVADTTGPISSNVTATPNPVAVGNSSTLTANADDSSTGGSKIASAAYNIDGGSFSPMAAADAAFDQVSENVIATLPLFTVSGLHTLCVRGVDAAGNTGASECILLVVYDPSGAFVTGGGSVNSPAGADVANPSTAGPATFGFVSKYLPGRSTPDGNLEFQFKAGNLDFKSTSMDWLVVTGEPRGQFRGTGSINGATVCKFQVDAWDASFQPGNADAFGLKIFSCDSGGDRYNLAAVPLAKGSVIIHK